MPEQSLREALNDAFDEVEGESEGFEERQEEEIPSGEEEGEHEEEAPTGGEAEGETAGEVPDPAGDPATESEESGEPDGDAVEQTDTKAPNAWKVGAKESWKDVPASAQQEIVRREREHDQLLQENARNRSVAQEFRTTVEPYMHNIQAEGVSAAEAVGNLLQTAASLQSGSALVKAQTITRLIGAYGVDIQTLSDVLTDTHEPTEEDRIQAAVDQRMAPYQQQNNQYQQQQYDTQQADQATVKAETDAWAKDNEFVTEVGPQMADLLEMAANRNQNLTLDEAYVQACRMNPEVFAVIQQREAAARAAENGGVARRKRKAGSSVSGTGAGNPGTAKPDTSVRGALEAAWDEVASR